MAAILPARFATQQVSIASQGIQCRCQGDVQAAARASPVTSWACLIGLDCSAKHRVLSSGPARKPAEDSSLESLTLDPTAAAWGSTWQDLLQKMQMLPPSFPACCVRLSKSGLAQPCCILSKDSRPLVAASKAARAAPECEFVMMLISHMASNCCNMHDTICLDQLADEHATAA